MNDAETRRNHWITSLDGYVADEKGDYDWAMPDDEVFGFVNDFERPVGTYLYGAGCTRR